MVISKEGLRTVRTEGTHRVRASLGKRPGDVLRVVRLDRRLSNVPQNGHAPRWNPETDSYIEYRTIADQPFDYNFGIDPVHTDTRLIDQLDFAFEKGSNPKVSITPHIELNPYFENATPELSSFNDLMAALEQVCKGHHPNDPNPININACYWSIVNAVKEIKNMFKEICRNHSDAYRMDVVIQGFTTETSTTLTFFLAPVNIFLEPSSIVIDPTIRKPVQKVKKIISNLRNHETETPDNSTQTVIPLDYPPTALFTVTVDTTPYPVKNLDLEDVLLHELLEKLQDRYQDIADHPIVVERRTVDQMPILSAAQEINITELPDAQVMFTYDPNVVGDSAREQLTVKDYPAYAGTLKKALEVARTNEGITPESARYFLLSRPELAKEKPYRYAFQVVGFPPRRSLGPRSEIVIVTSTKLLKLPLLAAEGTTTASVNGKKEKANNKTRATLETTQVRGLLADKKNVQKLDPTQLATSEGRQAFVAARAKKLIEITTTEAAPHLPDRISQIMIALTALGSVIKVYGEKGLDEIPYPVAQQELWGVPDSDLLALSQATDIKQAQLKKEIQAQAAQSIKIELEQRVNQILAAPLTAEERPGIATQIVPENNLKTAEIEAKIIGLRGKVKLGFKATSLERKVASAVDHMLDVIYQTTAKHLIGTEPLTPHVMDSIEKRAESYKFNNDDDEAEARDIDEKFLRIHSAMHVFCQNFETISVSLYNSQLKLKAQGAVLTIKKLFDEKEPDDGVFTKQPSNDEINAMVTIYEAAQALLARAVSNFTFEVSQSIRTITVTAELKNAKTLRKSIADYIKTGNERASSQKTAQERLETLEGLIKAALREAGFPSGLTSAIFIRNNPLLVDEVLAVVKQRFGKVTEVYTVAKPMISKNKAIINAVPWYTAKPPEKPAEKSAERPRWTPPVRRTSPFNSRTTTYSQAPDRVLFPPSERRALNPLLVPIKDLDAVLKSTKEY